MFALCTPRKQGENELRVQEPRLVDLLATLLSVHAAYFHRQRCRDRFEGALGIAALRAAAAGGADGAAAAAQPVPGQRWPWVYSHVR